MYSPPKAVRRSCEPIAQSLTATSADAHKPNGANIYANATAKLAFNALSSLAFELPFEFCRRQKSDTHFTFHFGAAKLTQSKSKFAFYCVGLRLNLLQSVAAVRLGEFESGRLRLLSKRKVVLVGLCRKLSEELFLQAIL